MYRESTNKQYTKKRRERNDEYIIPLFLPCAIVVVLYYLYT